jgi:molecular chaperone GrpE
LPRSIAVVNIKMKNPFKKRERMEDKDPNVPEQEQPNNGAEKPETPETVAEKSPENEKIKELQQQLEESRNRYLYLFSDFENYKRNAARERIDLIQTAGRDILASLLPILDDFDRAAKNDGMPDGITLIHNKLQHTLDAKGLKVMGTKAGDAFNAELHEAIAEIPAASDELKGKIVDILEQGYTLGERIIRYAKVVVGK